MCSAPHMLRLPMLASLVAAAAAGQSHVMRTGRDYSAAVQQPSTETEVIPLHIRVDNPDFNPHRWDAKPTQINSKPAEKVLTEGSDKSSAEEEKSESSDLQKVLSGDHVNTDDQQQDHSLIEENSFMRKEKLWPTADGTGPTKEEKEMLKAPSPLAEAFSRRYSHRPEQHEERRSKHKSGHKQAHATQKRSTHHSAAFGFGGDFRGVAPPSQVPKRGESNLVQESARDMEQPRRAKREELSQDELKALKRQQEMLAEQQHEPTQLESTWLHSEAAPPMPSMAPSPTPLDGF